MSDPQHPQPTEPEDFGRWQPEAAQPSGPAHPVQPAQPGEPFQQGQPGQPMQQGQPFQQGQPGQQVKRPATVLWGVILMAVVAVLSVILSFVGYAMTASASASLAGQLLPFVIVNVVVVLVEAALLFFVWQGRGWARIALAVIVAINAVLGIISGGGAGWLGIIAVVLLFLPASNAWFQSRAR